MQVQQQLFGRRLVDAPGVGSGVELGQQLDQIAVCLAGFEQVLARAAVQIRIEVLGRQPGEQLAELGVRRRSGQGIALQPVTCLEELRRDRWPVGLAAAPGNEAGLGFPRQVEPVGDQPLRLLTLGGVVEPGEASRA